MSNTDGEDTQQDWQDGVNDEFINGPNRPRGFTRGPKFANIKNTNEIQQELASLREQLKQQEEVIRELTDLIGDMLASQEQFGTLTTNLIEKAKSLTTKDK